MLCRVVRVSGVRLLIPRGWDAFQFDGRLYVPSAHSPLYRREVCRD
jgi:hypothetical protein